MILAAPQALLLLVPLGLFLFFTARISGPPMWLRVALAHPPIIIAPAPTASITLATRITMRQAPCFTSITPPPLPQQPPEYDLHTPHPDATRRRT